MLGTGTVAIGDKQWTVGVATTPEDLSKGLAGVESIPVNTGMLFDLGAEQIITVTAVDMLFPVDVIFIDSDLKVTEVAYSLMPGDWGTANLPAQYFLEVNVGEAAGVESGDTVVVNVSPGGTLPWQPPSTEIDISSMMYLMIVMMMVVMMMKMMTGAFEPEEPRMLGGAKLPPGYEPITHSIHGPERERLVDQYGTWAVGRAESVCPEDDVSCVERESARLLEAYRRG